MRRITPLLDGLLLPLVGEGDATAPKSHEHLSTAGEFYLEALQDFERRPESAYLGLITAGEVLSSYFTYADEDLLDDALKELLARTHASTPDGPLLAQQVRSRLTQIKRTFAKTLLRLIKDSFFGQSESQQSFAALRQDDFESRLGAAYNLRSEYVHSGSSFGRWMRPGRCWEIQLGQPVVSDHAFGKILAKAPTYVGLERVIRFALLRFMHLELCPIDPTLDDQ